MKVCLAQTRIIWEEKEENLNSAETYIIDAKKNNVDVILFPEMSFTGFSMNAPKTGEENRYTFDRISKLAKEKEIIVGFGWVRKKGDICENVYSIVDERGQLISEYAKIHPFSYSGEDQYFVGGDKIVIYRIKNIPFSTFICYDLRFPEIFRTVSESVHMIILPACWPSKRSEHWKTLLRARAIENQVYIFAVNCQGDIGELYYSGDSCIINPNGEILHCLSDKRGAIICNVEDDVDQFRNSFPVLKDKKIVSELQVVIQE